MPAADVLISSLPVTCRFHPPSAFCLPCLSTRLPASPPTHHHLQFPPDFRVLQPNTMVELENLPGMGAVRAKQYGERIMR